MGNLLKGNSAICAKILNVPIARLFSTIVILEELDKSSNKLELLGNKNYMMEQQISYSRISIQAASK